MTSRCNWNAQHTEMFWIAKSPQSSQFAGIFLLMIKTLRGERGIRTPGPVTVNSFQDCRNRPLCQLSEANILAQINSSKTLMKFWLTFRP